MNKDEIVQALQKHQYNQIQADGVANELSQIDSQLIPLLEKWIKDDTETDYAVEGFSLIELKSLYKMSYPAALLTIDWLIKEPETASFAIKKGIK
jgi:hypothetical protein